MSYTSMCVPFMYNINHVQYVYILDKARDPRARSARSARGQVLYRSIHTVFGHGLHNLCHRKNAIGSLPCLLCLAP